MIAEIDEERRKVWVALSDLFLDTSYTDDELLKLGEFLASSKYSKEKLKDILLDEVAPVVVSNLFSMTGVWGGFDERWLIDSVSKRIVGGRGRGRVNGLLYWWYLRKSWLTVMEGLDRKRAAPSNEKG